MSEISNSIDKIINLGLAALLKSHGFKKDARTWRKSHGNDFLIVNVQASTGNIESEGKFTINLGVYNFSIEKLSGNELNGKPKEHNSTIRERLGVIAYGYDYWWAVNTHIDSEKTSSDVIQKMKDFGIPWLNAHTLVLQISASLKEQPSRQSISAALLSGNEEEAINRLKTVIETRPAAQKMFQSWGTSIGLKL